MGHEDETKVTPGRCGTCGHWRDADGICQPCRAAKQARSRHWYEENVTEASARRTAHNRVTRRFTKEEVEAIRQRLVAEQDGACACCLTITDALTVEWSIDEYDDDNIPSLRAAICRRCKIAVNRYIRPSKFVLTPKTLERVSRYVAGRSWRHPDDVLRALGVDRRRRAEESRAGRLTTEADVAIEESARLADWLESITGT
jgi:hypothetical protein